jgi:hypothetical protein
MPEKDRESIVSKATAMKKAGFHPVMIVVITVLSSPGIWQQFFDDTDEQALEAIQKAYPVLSKEVEHLRDDNERLYGELQAMRRTMTILYAGGMGYPAMGMGAGGGASGDFYGALMPPEALFPAAADGDGDADEEGAEGASEGAEGMLSLPAPAPDFDGDGIGDESPLEGLMQQQRMPVREKLPDLGELMGKK